MWAASRKFFEERAGEIEFSERTDESKLKRIEIFDSVESFRAGTLKFEPNPHYCDERTKFDLRQAAEFDERNLQKRQRRNDFNAEAYEDERRRFVEQRVKDRKPEVRHFKTFVPIFPYLYQAIDGGRDLGNKTQFTLTGER